MEYGIFPMKTILHHCTTAEVTGFNKLLICSMSYCLFDTKNKLVNVSMIKTLRITVLKQENRSFYYICLSFGVHTDNKNEKLPSSHIK